MGKWYLSAIVLVVGMMSLTLGCTNSGGASDMAVKQCYGLVEGDTESMLIFEGDEKSAQMTILENRNGIPVAEPESHLGRIENNVYIQANGMRAVLGKPVLTWPGDSLMAGVSFKAVPCPER